LDNGPAATESIGLKIESGGGCVYDKSISCLARESGEEGDLAGGEMYLTAALTAGRVTLDDFDIGLAFLEGMCPSANTHE
jgi:hypothetical protein